MEGAQGPREAKTEAGSLPNLDISATPCQFTPLCPHSCPVFSIPTLPPITAQAPSGWLRWNSFF